MKQNRLQAQPVPNQAVAVQQLLAQAVACHQSGQPGQAGALYRQILTVQPGHFDALHLLGVISAQSGQFEEAVELIGRAIQVNLKNPGAYFNHGNALLELNRYPEALESYGRAITLQPNHPAACWKRGLALQNLSQFEAALVSFDRAIALKADYAEAYNSRGTLLIDLARYENALASLERAIALRPNYAEAHYHKGIVFNHLGEYESALLCFDQAISLQPDLVDAYICRGETLRNLKLYVKALLSVEQAAAIQPDLAEAYYNRGILFNELKQVDAAIANYTQAIDLKPDYAEAYQNLGLIRHELRQYQAALKNFAEAIALKPDHVEAYLSRGNTLQKLDQLLPALESYEQAIALKPDYADAYNNHGLACIKLRKFTEALQSFARVIALNPDYDYIYGQCLQIRLQLCDWNGMETELAEFAAKAGTAAKMSNPFTALALTGSAALQQKIAEVWTADKNPGNGGMAEPAKYPRHAKLRVGYFSADFHNHPVAILTAELFEIHDRSRFEIMAFSLSEPETKDQLRIRLEAGFDRFIEVQNLSDEEVVKLARELEIDIAVDLGGHTGKCRTGIFALRAAPLQVSYLGFAGTMGADYMDYLIADKIVIPPASRRYYTEKIAYLPHSFFVHDSTRRISDGPVNRAQFGLPETGFVFCCFNNTYKLNPATFTIWMRILTAVENSVLWLFEGNPTAGANLKQAAGQSGVDPDRLVFAERLPQIEEHLGRQALADLFLDTLPYNAHTTACDALWAGLPVLTCLGESFAGRVAASQLSAIGLPELIAETPAQYEALAIELAANAEKLAGVKARLAQNRLTTPLFDTRLFTGHLQAAYTQMYERYQADLACEHINV